MTHSELVQVAAGWLRNQRGCAVVLTELATTGETPDAIGWNGTHSTLVECKVSRADFVADGGKFFRRFPEAGIGQHRFLFAPAGIVPLEAIPPGWGLLELTGSKIRLVKKSEYHEANHRHEIGLLLSTLRRIGQQSPKGVSIRAYTIETRNRASIGIEPEPDDENLKPQTSSLKAPEGPEIGKED